MSDVPGHLRASDAKRRIRAIQGSGWVVFSRHAKDEMRKDELSLRDVENVLRGGVVREPEWENGSWRYHVETAKIRVVIAFHDESTLIVVTAMRRNR
ncbi:MAG TPA: DUF4258 domain-containing protein [Archangium sp.]|uniref:DUF4258 domain-containing protein n=1 Tax=Archangium sp. TaxID=1872627 RepID=UPI002E325A34|nr:DUF4258 domain-containing protein [Archangium sp.]HEX5744876.1 DUF4258 domain-containing protein [Archangium sp.]